MRRVDTATSTSVKPTPPAATGSGGYYTDGDPGAGQPPTIVPAWHLNSMQDEICNAITDDGDTLDGSDDTQLAQRLSPLKTLRSGVATTGEVTTTHLRAVVASGTSEASGSGALVAAAAGSEASGVLSAVIASSDGVASGSASAVIASQDTAASGMEASGAWSAVIASISGSGGVEAAGTVSAVVASEDSTIAATSTRSVIVAADASHIGASAASEHAAIIATAAGDVDADHAAIIGGTGGSLFGARSVILGGSANSVSGDDAAALASVDCDVTGDNAVSLASEQAVVSAASAAVIACGSATEAVIVDHEQSAMIASGTSKISAGGTAEGHGVLLASTRCELASPLSVATGYHATTAPTYGAPADQNLTFRLDSTSGDVYSDGTLGVGAADYAELFEALDPADVPPVGSLLARAGLRVRVAQPGDRVLGVHSACPGVVGNNPMQWQGRYARDEWGRRTKVDHEMVRWPRTDEREGYDGLVSAAPTIPEDAERYSVTWYEETAEFRQGEPFALRSTRPEWVPVGLLGQIRVRVDDTVNEGDDVTAGADGIGTQGVGRGRGRAIECMIIESPYDEKRGYGIALCLVG